MRVVLDTNVLIAAFATHGICHLVFETTLVHHKILVSPFLMNEFKINLKKKLKLSSIQIVRLVSFLKTNALMIKDTPVPNLTCSDLDDVKILALAINGQADVLVTGDQDLLVLGFVKDIPIINPRQLWNQFKTQKSSSSIS